MVFANTLALRLAPDAFRDLVLCVFDECHLLNDANRGITADILMATSPTLILALGDNQYVYGGLRDFSTYFGRSWGLLKARIRPVPGNHEYETPGASGYFGYFGALAGSSRRGYYSYGLGAWHILALNSAIPHNASSPQYAWLKSDLLAHPNLCTLAYWHHPRWSSGEHGNNGSLDAFWRLLYESAAAAKAALSLNVEDLELDGRRARLATTNGPRWLSWESGTARLLPRLVAGRTRGPVFLADRKPAPARMPKPADICPDTGRGRLSYERAEYLFKQATRPLDPSGAGYTLHQLSRSHP